MTRSTTRRTTSSRYDDGGAPGRPGAPLHVVRWGRMSRWAVLVLITLAHALGGLAMGIKQTGLTLGGLVGALALPPLALVAGWRAALAAGGALALVSAALTLIVYRSPAGTRGASAAAWPRLGELRVFLRRPGVIVVFLSVLALSVAQSSVLAHLPIYARETFALSPVVAGQMLALAQAGGTAGRLAWGVISDRFFGGRRRPGVVVNALIGAGAYALLALGDRMPLAGLVPLALVAGVGAFGWVGLYFALVA